MGTRIHNGETYGGVAIKASQVIVTDEQELGISGSAQSVFEELIKKFKTNNIVSITKANYDVLPEEDKKNTIFLIYNESSASGELVYNGVQYSGDFDKVLQAYVTNEELAAHIANRIHITESERITWNNKTDNEDFTSHAVDNDIHVSIEEKDNWNNMITGNSALSKLTYENGELLFDNQKIAVTIDKTEGVTETDLAESIFEQLKW